MSLPSKEERTTPGLDRYEIGDLESKDAPLWWHLKGLSYTASGYGSKIPTPTMVLLPGCNRWRRVYCMIYSNAGTCYVLRKGERVIVW